ncbi:MAG TPA: hypothetical protein PLU73_10570 [Bacteroidia bacterium]|nr:hypothetical protein [Bacteroidia bacterium]
MKKTILIFVLFWVSTSCKKNRICECKNSNGTYEAGELEATKQQAKKDCKALSEGQTECYLKN